MRLLRQPPGSWDVRYRKSEPPRAIGELRLRARRMLREALVAAREFARVLGASPEFLAYEQAAESIGEDTAARTLLAECQEARQTIRMLQSWSGGGSSHSAQFRELEEKALADPRLRRYFDAQEKLIALIQELNDGLREELGLDFARFGKPAGGCC